LASDPTFNRDDLSAVSRLHISRRTAVETGSVPTLAPALFLALHNSANPRPSNNHRNATFEAGKNAADNFA
jgi:hypothetical protein